MRLITFVIASIFFATACNNQPAKTDSSDVAEKENDTKFANKKQENDAQFLVDATDLSLEAVLLGKLAQNKATDTSLKGVGTLLVQSHTKALKDVTDLAKTKMVTLPDSANHDAYTQAETLRKKTGQEFAQLYCERVIDTYKKAIASFEKESTDSRDQDIKEWAANMLPQLRSHMDRVFEYQKKYVKAN